MFGNTNNQVELKFVGEEQRASAQACLEKGSVWMVLAITISTFHCYHGRWEQPSWTEVRVIWNNTRTKLPLLDRHEKLKQHLWNTLSWRVPAYSCCHKNLIEHRSLKRGGKNDFSGDETFDNPPKTIWRHTYHAGKSTLKNQSPAQAPFHVPHVIVPPDIAVTTGITTKWGEESRRGAD